MPNENRKRNPKIKFYSSPEITSHNILVRK
jgi:hypothetical protein